MSWASANTSRFAVHYHVRLVLLALTAGAFLCAVRVYRSHSLGWAIGTGILWGAAYLVRHTQLAIVAALLSLFLLAPSARRIRLRNTLALQPQHVGATQMMSQLEQQSGLKPLIAKHEARIRSGILAYNNLLKLRAGDKSPDVRAAFDAHKQGRVA